YPCARPASVAAGYQPGRAPPPTTPSFSLQRPQPRLPAVGHRAAPELASRRLHQLSRQVALAPGARRRKGWSDGPGGKPRPVKQQLSQRSQLRNGYVLAVSSSCTSNGLKAFGSISAYCTIRVICTPSVFLLWQQEQRAVNSFQTKRQFVP